MTAGEYFSRRVLDVASSYAKQHVEEPQVKAIVDALNSADPVERKAAREAARSGLEAANIDVAVSAIEAEADVKKV